MRKSGVLVQGVGINTQDRPIRENGKQAKEYKLWARVLERCTEGFLIKNPTYAGCQVSENFKSYSFFYDWCQTQQGFLCLDRNGNTFELDKDLLIRGNKLYSENTCVFLPSKLNCLLIRKETKRGKYPIGVYYNKGRNKFTAQCQKHLGLFVTPEDAFQAYKAYKESYIKEVANEYRTQLDPRAYQALLNYTVEITD